MTYTDFISQFEVFDNPPKKDGFQRHHIVPTCEQKKLYGKVTDNRQIYCSLPMHMWLHILYDREHGTNTAKIFLTVCNKPADFFDCWEKCLAYSYTLRKKREEGIKKISEAMKNPEVRQKIADSMKEAMNKPEVRQKVSDYMKEVMKNPEIRQKMSDSHKGKKFPDEIKKKMSDSHKGKNTWAKGRKWWNNGTIDKMSKTCPGPEFVLGRLNYKRQRLVQE